MCEKYKIKQRNTYVFTRQVTKITISKYWLITDFSSNQLSLLPLFTI